MDLKINTDFFTHQPHPVLGILVLAAYFIIAGISSGLMICEFFEIDKKYVRLFMLLGPLPMILALIPMGLLCIAFVLKAFVNVLRGRDVND